MQVIILSCSLIEKPSYGGQDDNGISTACSQMQLCTNMALTPVIVCDPASIWCTGQSYGELFIAIRTPQGPIK